MEKDCWLHRISHESELAMENDVRLIEGDEFVRMLLSAGLTGLDV